MNTFINLGLHSLNERLSEVELIVDEAVNHEVKNPPLYGALCRSAHVLLCAHFEGYIKDLVKNSLEDINSFSSFRSTNFDIKKRYCEYFVKENSEKKDSKEDIKKLKELVEIFETHEAKFKLEFFHPNSGENPKASVLDKTGRLFGIDNFFKQLRQSRFDAIFSNTNEGNIQLCHEIEEYLFDRTESFPFAVSLDFLEIDESNDDRDNLWDVFLSEFLKKRHDIAHGRELENCTSHSQIEDDKVKIKIILLALTCFICVAVNPAETQN